MIEKHMSKCWLFHDWEYLEQTFVSNALWATSYHKRVCMRCGKAEDTMTPQLKKAAAQKRNTEHRLATRKQRAIFLFEQSTKGQKS